jgi:hypothetical protein
MNWSGFGGSLCGSAFARVHIVMRITDEGSRRPLASAACLPTCTPTPTQNERCHEFDDPNADDPSDRLFTAAGDRVFRLYRRGGDSQPVLPACTVVRRHAGRSVDAVNDPRCRSKEQPSDCGRSRNRRLSEKCKGTGLAARLARLDGRGRGHRLLLIQQPAQRLRNGVV